MKSLLLNSILFLLLSSVSASTQTDFNELLDIRKLTGKVLLIRYGIQSYDAVTAVSTEKGIVVFDSGISPTITEKYRDIIEKEFGRKDFIYLISSHGHHDHVAGNQVFPEAVNIGHYNCKEEMQRNWKKPEQFKNRYKNTIKSFGEDLNSEYPTAIQKKRDVFMKNMLSGADADLESKYIFSPPALLFNDKLTLKLGDVTLNIYYFGKIHSTSDIIVHIPEEKVLFAGSIFTYPGFLGYNQFEKEDVLRWNKVMNLLSSENTDIDHIINGHGIIMNKSDLIAFHNKIKKILENMNSGKELYSASMFMKQINEKGIDAALSEFNKLVKNNNQYYFLEEEFIRLAFMYMNMKKYKETIEILKLCLGMFPNCSFAYELSGEAYLANGDRKLSIRNFEKALKLNPGNEFVKGILNELK